MSIQKGQCQIVGKTERAGSLTSWGTKAIVIVLVSSSSPLQAEGPLPAPSSAATTEQCAPVVDALCRSKTQGDEQPAVPWVEPADAVLIQRSEVEWFRYGKSVFHLPDWLDLGLENRTRFESYDNPWRANQRIGDGQSDAQIALRSRVRVGLGGNGPLRFVFEGQDARSYLSKDPGDFRDTTTVNEFDILQLFGSLSLHNVGGSSLRTDVHFGRMTMDFGKRRLIARNDFRNSTNAFDGLHWQISRDKAWRVRTFLVEPVIGHETSLDTQNLKSLFWGTYVENRQLAWFHFDAYYLGLNDRHPADGSGRRSYSTFGGRLYKLPASGEVDYEIESAWQTGTRDGIDHFAHFQHVELGYTIDMPWSPRLLIQYDYASGDRQPGDSHNEGFDSLYGARRYEYMPTGVFGPFFRTNISSPGWRVVVTPAPGWTLQLKHRVWYLAESKDRFGSSGLRDSTGLAGTSLGHDVEIRIQWALNHNMDFDAGYDHWFKGSYFDRLPASSGLPPGGDQDTDYFYFQMRIRI